MTIFLSRPQEINLLFCSNKPVIELEWSDSSFIISNYFFKLQIINLLFEDDPLIANYPFDKYAIVSTEPPW